MNSLINLKPSRLLLLLLLAGATACASSPPKELVDARAAYKRASMSPAKQLSPAELHDARVALQRAENAYDDDSDSAETRTYAYVAQRKSELAEIEANTLALQQRAATEKKMVEQQQAKSAAETKEELQSTRSELDARERELAAERAARDEERAAIEKLVAEGAAASVREEARGTVLTLSGTLMFPSGKSTLRPGARKRLDEVAEAISQLGDKQIQAVGHTDSTGKDEVNLPLSQARAEAVRAYLVEHGVPEHRIVAKGMGSSEPIADNSTAEGRAENRRVELIFQTTVESLQPQNNMQPMPMQPMEPIE